MQNFLATHNLSVWLLVTSLVLSSVMAHPSIGSIITIGMNAIILVLLRKTAMMEGAARSALFSLTRRR